MCGNNMFDLVKKGKHPQNSRMYLTSVHSGYYYTARVIMYYNNEIATLENEIRIISDMLEPVVLLRTLPRIGPPISTGIVAEVDDINNFKNSKGLVAFCGLDPGVKQSGAYNKYHNKSVNVGHLN